ncbi:50S ribosomal protein L25 [Nymphon striatum]|nr:50S ribosomal protein L25 [Nymphon striatum]
MPRPHRRIYPFPPSKTVLYARLHAGIQPWRIPALTYWRLQMAGEIPDLIAQERTGTGKGAARQARRDGMVPGIVFGGDVDPLPINLDFNKLLTMLRKGRFKATLFNMKVEGHDDVRVICRDVQRHVVKDLPTHMGGGHAGNNGLRSIHAHIGPEYARVRLGVGHPGHKDAVPGYVLRDFPKADEAWLDDVLRGVSDGAADLAAGDTAKFLNTVAMRVNPPRPSTGTKGPKGAKGPKTAPKATPPLAAEAADQDATRSPLQKLMDHFK